MRFEEPQEEEEEDDDEYDADLRFHEEQFRSYAFNAPLSNLPRLRIWPLHDVADDPPHDVPSDEDLDGDRTDSSWHDGGEPLEELCGDPRSVTSRSPLHIPPRLRIWPSSCAEDDDVDEEEEDMRGDVNGSGSVERQSDNDFVEDEKDAAMLQPVVQIWPPPNPHNAHFISPYFRELPSEEQEPLEERRVSNDESARKHAAKGAQASERHVGWEKAECVMHDDDAGSEGMKNCSDIEDDLLFAGVSAADWNESGEEDLEPPLSSRDSAADLAAELRCLSLGLADDAVAGYKLREQRRIMELKLKRLERCQNAAWLAEVRGLAPGSSRLLRAMVAKGNRNAGPRASDAASDGVSTSSGGPRADVLSMHSSSS